MTFKSSNTESIESMADTELLKEIRIAMGEGCIRPSRVFDMIDELIDRFCEYQYIHEP